MHKGYMLLELVLTLCLMGIFIGLAAPTWHDWLNTNATAMQVNQLIEAIHLARSTAIQYNTTISICPSQDGNSCSGTWNDGYLIFINPNRLNQPALPANRVRFYKQGTQYGMLHVNENSMLHINSLGATRNSTFHYCPKNKDSRFAREIIVSITGRIRVAYPSSGLCK